jgi:hypothetical protein
VIQADDVDDLLHEQRVGGELEAVLRGCQVICVNGC